MNKILLFLIFFFSKTLSAQKVFITDFVSKADVKLYVVKNISEADLCVYKVHNPSQAKGNGLWYFTEHGYEADK